MKKQQKKSERNQKDMLPKKAHPTWLPRGKW